MKLINEETWDLGADWQEVSDKLENSAGHLSVDFNSKVQAQKNL